MNRLRKILDNMRPSFQPEGRLHAFRSIYEGFESFLFVPNATAKSGTHIHDAIDSKRIMSMVVIALLPALLFGMYNVGYQNALAAGQLASTSCWAMLLYGALVVLPKVIVTYIVGLGIEFAWAQYKGEEIQEGFLVSGIIIPLIVPANLSLWMLAIAVAFAVVFAKEIFGGTGMNIFNVSLVARAFLFFSYPQQMSGDQVWIARQSLCGLGYDLPDTFTQATPLAQLATGAMPDASMCDMIVGLIPGSIGETSVIAIAIGAAILFWTGIASWKITLSVFLGAGLTTLAFQAAGLQTASCWHHFVMGGFCFGAVFMATDPVTAARTETGKWIYGFLIGFIVILVRLLNPGYPEGMMLAILLMNMLAPTIDYCVVERNISKRKKRQTAKKA